MSAWLPLDSNQPQRNKPIWFNAYPWIPAIFWTLMFGAVACGAVACGKACYVPSNGGSQGHTPTQLLCLDLNTQKTHEPPCIQGIDLHYNARSSGPSYIRTTRESS